MGNSRVELGGIALTRAARLTPVVAFLGRGGARVERLLGRVKLSPEGLRDAEALVPMSMVLRFMEEAARVEGLEHLGLLVGQETSLPQLGLYGSLIR